MIFILQRTGQGENFFTLNFFKPLLLIIIISTANIASRELLCPKLFNIYMYVNDIDIFITENWIFHPKFLYV